MTKERAEHKSGDPAAGPSVNRVPEGVHPSPTILIVDDRKENLVALRQVLADVDAEIVEAGNGNEALAATLDHDFAVAVLDVQMPGMDGYELARLLRGDPRTCRLPVIFLTAAYGDEEHLFKGYETGAVDYIVKPYNPAVLLSKVNVFLEFHRKNVALAASAQCLRLALDAGAMATWDWHVQSGEVIWNDEHYRILGYRVGEVKPSYRAWADRMHPDDAAATEAILRQSMEQGSDYAAEFRVRWPDGTVRWLEARGRFECDAAGKPVRSYGVMMNITGRKQAEEALRESERRERERAAELTVLLDAVPMPVFIAHDPDCLHMSANRAADELLRVSSGGEVSLSAPADVRPCHFKAVKGGRELRLDELPAQRAARGVPVSDFEFSLVFDDGTVRQVLGYGTPLLDEAGRPRGAVHVLVDITGRKRSEEALRASNIAALNVMEDAVEARQLAEQAAGELARQAERLRISNEDLTRFNRVAVDRELRMIELKKEVNAMCAKTGLPPAYKVEANDQ